MDDIVNHSQRNIQLKNLEVHPTEQTLILNCESESSLTTDYPENNFLETNREFQRYIRLKSLEETTDIDSIVTQVIAKSKGLLTESHRDEIKQLIVYLKNRSIQSTVRATATGATFDSFRPKTAGARLTDSQLQSFNGHSVESNHHLRLTSSTSVNSFSSNGIDKNIDNRVGSLNLESIFGDIKRLINRSLVDESYNNENISLNSVCEYTELLYEDHSKMIKGASAIYHLSLNHENLLPLSSNEPLIYALARLLSEDGRKNVHLGTILIGIFANFSVYRQFHSTITEHKVGALCLEIIQCELEREETLFSDLADIQLAMKTESRSLSNSSSLHSSLSYSHLSTLSAPNAPGSRASSIGLTNEYERALRKYQSLVVKQNLLLRAAYTVLLHLSEDRKVEIKMVNKGIIGCLVKTLDRENWLQLLYLVIYFLKRFSIYGENKDSMITMGIADKLFAILDNQSASSSVFHLVNILELVYNLSFDTKFRSSMIQHNIVSKLFSFLHRAIKSLQASSMTSVSENSLNTSNTDHFNLKQNNLNFILEKLIYQIVYLFTIESEHRVLVTLSLGPDRINLLTDRAIKYLNDSKRPYPFTELMSLLINLSTNRLNAQLICDKDRLKRFLNYIVTTLASRTHVIQDDIMVLKLIRNLSQHEDAYKMIFLDYLEILVTLLVIRPPRSIDLNTEILMTQGSHYHQHVPKGTASNWDSMVSTEILGILCNMINLPGVDWLTLASSKGLFKWISTVLTAKDHSYEDDLILECILVISCIVSCHDACLYILKCDCLKLLIDQLNAKQEEDEIVLQIIFIFHLMLRESDVRKIILAPETQVLAYFFDLMNDKNPEIRKLCKASLSIIFEFEDGLKDKVREESFKVYNKQWLEMILSRQDNSIGQRTGKRQIMNDNFNKNNNNSDSEDVIHIPSQDGVDDNDEESCHFKNKDNDEDILGLTYNNLLLHTDILSDSSPSSGPITDDQEASTSSTNEPNYRSSLMSRPQTGYKKRGIGREIKSSVSNDTRSTDKANNFLYL